MSEPSEPTNGKLAKRAPDWALADNLFLAGHGTRREIAEAAGVSVGALNQHIQRKGLVSERNKMNESAAKFSGNTSVAAHGEAVKKLLAVDLHKSAQQLPGMDHSTTARGLKVRQEAVNELIEGASKVFAWKENIPQVVSLTFLSSVHPVTVADTAIDVNGSAEHLSPLPVEPEQPEAPDGADDSTSEI